MRLRTRIILFGLAAVALGLRLVFAGLVVGFDSPLKADEADYHMLAAHIAGGEGFTNNEGQPTGARPPGYPAFLSVLYRVAGPDPVVARVTQVALGVVIVLLTFALARRHFGEAVGLVAAAFVTFNPFLIFISGYGLSENLYVVLLLAALLVMPRPAGDDLPPSRWVFGAVVLGLAALTRPSGLPMAAWIAFGGLVAATVDWPTRLGQFAIVVLVVLATLLPWSFRNQTMFGEWVGLTTHGGITFYQGNNRKVVDVPHYRGGVAPLAALPHIEEISSMDEAARDAASYSYGVEFLRENPELVPRLTWWKFKRFWRLESDMGLSGIRSGWWFGTDTPLGRVAAGFDAGLVYAAVAFPLMLAGLFLTRRRWRGLMFLYGIIVVHTAIALVFFGSIRGRIPIEPVIAVFAAAALVYPFQRRRGGGGEAYTSQSAQNP